MHLMDTLHANRKYMPKDVLKAKSIKRRLLLKKSTRICWFVVKKLLFCPYLGHRTLPDCGNGDPTFL